MVKNPLAASCKLFVELAARECNDESYLADMEKAYYAGAYGLLMSLIKEVDNQMSLLDYYGEIMTYMAKHSPNSSIN